MPKWAREADMIGKVFSRLTIESITPRENKAATHRKWVCLCECGQRTIVGTGNLRNGAVKSCGCLLDEALRSRATHRRCRTREYSSWLEAKKRCYNPRHKHANNYGGRGIRMAEEWRNNFQAFFAHMGNCPPNHSLDRINNDGHYEPGNCRWATRLEQSQNKRTNRPITHNGETKTIQEWGAVLGLPGSVLRKRLWRGWSVDEAITTRLLR